MLKAEEAKKQTGMPPAPQRQNKGEPGEGKELFLQNYEERKASQQKSG